MQELGIDGGMIGKKLLAMMPFVPCDKEVASSAEMIVGIIILLTFALINSITKKSSHLSFLCGAFMYGTLFMWFLLGMLIQDAESLDVYIVGSALSYGLIPIFVSNVICMFLPGSDSRKWILLAIYLVGGLLSSFITTKFLNAASGLNGVRVLIAIPAYLVTCCYTIVQLT